MTHAKHAESPTPVVNILEFVLSFFKHSDSLTFRLRIRIE